MRADTPLSGALVMGANYRALGVIRSLARRDIPAWLIRSDHHRIARFSRYASRVLAWPDVGDSQGVEYLLEVAARHGLHGWTLIPTDDRTAAVLARHRDALAERFVVAAPDWEQMRWAYDKRLTYELATKLRISQPRTWFPSSHDAARRVACEFPAILKPAIKREQNRFTEAKAWLVTSADELGQAYDAARELVPAEDIMIQELIAGGGGSQLSYAALAERGQVLASITACRTRQYPMDFGEASTYVETIDCPDAAEPARRLIEAIGYSGLVEVEFKRDRRDGTPRLLDVNARVWGWHTLGARAGVDFSYLEWRMRHGQRVPHIEARPGVRWVRTATDVPTAVGEIAAGRMRVRDYARSLRPPLEDAVFAMDDPLPGLLEPLVTARIAYRALRRRRRGERADHGGGDRSRPRSSRQRSGAHPEGQATGGRGVNAAAAPRPTPAATRAVTFVADAGPLPDARRRPGGRAPR
jgi:predicted ATP-grasp superfamily ATP-dependent carboligase